MTIMLGPLARVDEPLGREQSREHRAVVVADSSCTIAGLAYSCWVARPCDHASEDTHAA
ncbi:hypothetical protein PSAB6_60036 [Paraburkholderia sabiae]|nr:hypothetical protein PSAB6_60036 [Paraburkholderia sabiae]